MYSYFAYGLGIHSNIAIPEFMPTESQCDVQIKLDKNNPIPIEVSDDYHHLLKITPEEAFLFDRKVGTFIIRNGCEITIYPQVDADDSRIRLYLVGTIMSILLYQRGLFVLHGSAVEYDGGVVAFVGQSGWGKSSIAAALQAKGHRMIGDDVVPISIAEDATTVYPGFPQFKLYPEVASCLGHDESSLLLLHPQVEKKGLRFSEKFSHTSLPLKRIYVLSPEDTLAIEPLSFQQAVIDLVRHSIPTRWLQQPEGKMHFLQCTKLVKRIPIYRLKRSKDLSTLTTLAQMVVEHLAPNLKNSSE